MSIKYVPDHSVTLRFKNGEASISARSGMDRDKNWNKGGAIQSCSSSLKAENCSGSAPLQVSEVEEHVDIGLLWTAWSRLKPQAEAVTGAWGANAGHT